MKPQHKQLLADGNRQKPPRSGRPTPSTTSSDALTALDDIDDDDDDDITTSASESYANNESSSNEGKQSSIKRIRNANIVMRRKYQQKPLCIECGSLSPPASCF